MVCQTHIISGYWPPVCQIPSISLRLVCRLLVGSLTITYITQYFLAIFFIFSDNLPKNILRLIIYEKIRRVSQLIWKDVCNFGKHRIFLIYFFTLLFYIHKGWREPYEFFFRVLCMFLSITAKRTLIVVLYLYGCFVITSSVRNNKCLCLISR